MNITIRKIEEKDKNSVNNLYEKLVNGSNGMGYGYPEWLYEDIFCPDNTYTSYVALITDDLGKERQLVGYIMLEKNQASVYIQALYVEEDYRKKKIARRLLEIAQTYAENEGYNDLTVEMEVHLHHFYEKFGFKVKKRITDSKLAITKSLVKK